MWDSSSSTSRSTTEDDCLIFALRAETLHLNKMLHHGQHIILASKFVIPQLCDVIITTEMTQMVVGGAIVQKSFVGIPNW